MNILGYVAHYRVGTILDAEFEHTICHHTKVLCFVDYHMVSFADYFRFLDSFVKVRKRRQVIHIERIFRHIHIMPAQFLNSQEILVHGKNGLFPAGCTIFSVVCFQNSFLLGFGIFHASAQKLAFNLDFQAFVQRINLTLQRNRRILAYIILYRFPIHQKNQFPWVRRSAAGTVIHAAFTVLKALHKLLWIQINIIAQNSIPFQIIAVSFQILKPGKTAFYNALFAGTVGTLNLVLLVIPIFI